MTERKIEAPKFSDLAQLTKENGERQEVIIELLSELCELKTEQGKHEGVQATLNEEWREKWLEAKKSSVRSKARGVALTFIQIGAGLVAIYIGALQVNQDNSLVKAVIAFTEAVGRLLL